MAAIHVDIISDTICPFCYLGYKKLVAGIANSDIATSAVSIRFKPFQLDPTLPTSHAVNKRERYSQKFGADRVQAMEQAMLARGKECGINFSYGGSVRQTIDSHRLIEQAYEKGGEDMQRVVIQDLFTGYFENEKDIGDHAFLGKVGVDHRVFESEAAANDFFASNAQRENVAAGIARAQQLGVSGVPFFVINDKVAISGAQDPETFTNVLNRIGRGEKL